MGGNRDRRLGDQKRAAEQKSPVLFQRLETLGLGKRVLCDRLCPCKDGCMSPLGSLAPSAWSPTDARLQGSWLPCGVHPTKELCKNKLQPHAQNLHE